MNEHLHTEFVVGCYRCEIAQDERIWLMEQDEEALVP